MTEGIRLRIPFPVRSSADLERCRRRGCRWEQEADLLTEPGALESLRQADTAGFAAYAYPYATGPFLDLAADTMGFMFVLDDRLSRVIDRPPDWIAGVARELIGVIRGRDAESSCPGAPLVRAWSGLWRELCLGMSPAWRDRLAKHWTDFFHTLVQEDHHDRHGVVPDVETYQSLRYASGGVEIFLDLIERVTGVEAPARAHDTPWLRRMRYAVAYSAALINDIASLAREEERGERHNFILVLEHHEGLSRRQAIEKTAQVADRAIEELVLLRHELPRRSLVLGLEKEDRDTVEAFADALCSWIAGTAQWFLRAERYRAPARGASPDTPALDIPTTAARKP